MGVITMELKPQPGPQEEFLSSSADIAIYGGSAGGGKTYAILLEVLRHIDNPRFGVVVFRRQANQITSEGGLWDNAISMYTPLGARIKQSPLPQIVFPSGAKLSFRHIQYEKDVHSWQGAQICLECFDELTHFTEKQFFYMLSRNRSTCGVRPYIRATCNPDADSWVADFISWWIDQDTGYPIHKRSGIVRHFVRIDGNIIWGDNREELAAQYHMKPSLCKSVTFVASSIFDNKALLDADPGYLASLNALSTVEKERLLKGNWKIRPAAGLYFKRSQARIVKTIPDKIVSIARAWDLAATEITASNKNPDRTASSLIGRLRNGQYIVIDAIRQAVNASSVRKLVKNTAVSDRCIYCCNKILIPQDPGQAGKEQAQSYTRELAGFDISCHVVTGDKVTRAEPFAAQWQQGNVLLLEGNWNDEFIDEMEGFPDALHDDQVDAAADAFNAVALNNDWSGLIS